MTTNTITRTTATTYAERAMITADMDGGMLQGLALDRAAIREARKAYAAFRLVHGYADSAAMLTRPEAQPKLGKSKRYALGLMLTPARSLSVDIMRRTDATARPVNACPKASPGCAAACLAYAGHGAFNATQHARQIRHAFLLQHARAAGVLIGSEIARAIVKHGADGVTFRPNVLTDYRWEIVIPRSLAVMADMGARPYDYTAWAPTDRAPVDGYSLTYSAKESAHTSDAYLSAVLHSGENVAMPFAVRKGSPLPTFYVIDGMAFDVIDGDLTDDRTTDPRGTVGVIVGLRAKGSRGKSDASGFVRPVL